MDLIESMVRVLCHHYPNTFYASLVKIDGVKTPVKYNGVDMNPLLPVDNQCEFVYIRETSESNVRNVDVGGCTNAMFVDLYLRVVFYSKSKVNVFGRLQEFASILGESGYKFEMKNIISDGDKLIGEEFNNKKNIKVKNISYFAFDFKVWMEVNECNSKVC
jgi:hypothetical protein